MVPLCLQHLPFFALSSKFFKNLRSTFYQATMVFDNALTKAMISIQHYTFLPMMLVARFGDSFLRMPISNSCMRHLAADAMGFKPWHACVLCKAAVADSLNTLQWNAGFYAMSTFHLLAKGRPAIYKPFEVAAFLGFFTWCAPFCWRPFRWRMSSSIFVSCHRALW